jgi:CheY-like chemotaxis protein
VGKSVLVFDRDANARTALVELLRDVGHEVYSTTDAPSALLLVEVTQPHVVLADCTANRAENLALRDQLAAASFAPRVIFMVTRRDHAPCGVPILLKPIDLEQLFRVVDGHAM